jgi:transcription antitermination factor NusG
MTHAEQSDWFILRTAGRSTLNLAASLAEDGFETWTPVRMARIRVPRMNVKRDVRLPLLPSFVFVKAAHLVDLLELAQMIEKPRRDPNGGRWSRPAHRDFSVFHYLDSIPMVADRHLDPLRSKEREIIPKKDAPGFNRGAKVRVGSGAFGGLRGKVERCKSGYALVVFTDFKRPVKIPTWLLSEDEATSASRSLDEAA